MSIKIDLEFETKLDLELLSAGISTRLIRLVASLRLKTSRGWTNPYKAIIDTGSPITLIPKRDLCITPVLSLRAKRSNLITH